MQTNLTSVSDTFLAQRVGLKVDECRRQLADLVEQGVMGADEANTRLNAKLEQWLGADASCLEAAY